MKILVICFLLVKFGEGDIEITAVYDSGDPYTCLEGNRNISITCTVIGSYKSTVKWKKGVLLQATCSNANDNTCLNPPGYNEPRYSFSSSVLAKEFTFRISTTDVDADNGTYICEHGTEISNFDIEVCVPTTTERTITAPSTTTTNTATISSITKTTAAVVASSSTYSTSYTTLTTILDSTSITSKTTVSASGMTTKEPTVAIASTIIVPTIPSTRDTSVTSNTTPRSGLLLTSTAATVTQPTYSDKGLVVMIIVVSVIGSTLVIAICFMVLLMVQSTKCLGETKHCRVHSHRHDKYRAHQTTGRLKHARERSEINSLRPDHVFKGYWFYRGGVKNPVFEGSYENPPFVNYRETSEIFHEYPPPEYQY